MITVNDEQVEYDAGLTVAELLARLSFTSKTIAVWIDGEIVARDAYERTPVPDGANIQIVHAIVGG